MLIKFEFKSTFLPKLINCSKKNLTVKPFPKSKSRGIYPSTSLSFPSQHIEYSLFLVLHSILVKKFLGVSSLKFSFFIILSLLST